MNDLNRDDHYDDALGSAMMLPTWALRVWERRATRRLGRGTPTVAEQARLLAVRDALAKRAGGR
jgi:hypothetical protein